MASIHSGSLSDVGSFNDNACDVALADEFSNSPCGDGLQIHEHSDDLVHFEDGEVMGRLGLVEVVYSTVNSQSAI